MAQTLAVDELSASNGKEDGVKVSKDLTLDGHLTQVVDSDGQMRELSVDSAMVVPADLRLNDIYVFYYNNLAKLVITGIVPFVMLCFFNFKVNNTMITNIYLLTYMGVFDLGQTRAACSDGFSNH